MGKKQKILGSLFLSACVLGLGLTTNTKTVSAHGYVDTPASRGYQGVLDRSTLGWTEAMELYGNVITNPQSLEAPKGFPEAGPADGHIASAEGGFQQIGDFVLDNQTSTRWKKTDIATGDNTFTWTYTAAHKTSKWHYYMTKPGWDQNAPLTRDDLELIGTVNHDGSLSSNNLSHTISVPSDRMGYHVILAVWDVADTSNAFYNVIDVNVNNSVLPSLPTAPTNVKATDVTKNSISLTWDAQTTASSYNVFKNGVKVATVNTNQFEDTGLNADTAYSYQVQAVSTTGVTSEKSTAVSVKTLSENATEKPAAPQSLHSMGETENSISLMWSKSTHSAGIKSYQVYRNGVLIGETTETAYKDTNLNADTTYNYVVKAISNTNEVSENSNTLTVKTKAEEGTTTPGDYKEWEIGTFSSPKLYTANEMVSYNGKNYKTLQTHNNYGDATWAPDKAAALFAEVK